MQGILIRSLYLQSTKTWKRLSFNGVIVELKLIDFLLIDLFSLHIFSNCRSFEVSRLREFFFFEKKNI